MKKLNSRERLKICLDHREPDRIPIDFWATNETKAKLLEYFRVSDIEEVLQHFNVDFRYIDGPKYIGPEYVRPDGSREDHFGVPRKPVHYGSEKSGGTYSEVVEYPLERAASIDEIENYPKWPKSEWFDYECVRKQVQAVHQTGKVVVFMGDRLNRCAQLKPAMYVRGPEQIFIDTVQNPDLAKAIFRRITEFYSEYLRQTLEAAGGDIDIVFTGDDFGTQNSTFMSEEMWESLLKDGFKRMIDISHEGGAVVAHHTCGFNLPLIPHFIECGLDILNPLQPEVKGMDFHKIKREYGDRITFHGGISIQKTLPYGSPEDVRSEVKDRVKALAPDGGYIFCTSHNIQIDTPLENIEALFSAYKDFGRYG
jgi:uroporphyrinogen decarboxylase